MAISSKKALEAAKVIVDFCNEQKGCQNCIFRLYGADHWKCHMYAFDLQDVLSNIEAKKKNHGRSEVTHWMPMPQPNGERKEGVN